MSRYYKNVPLILRVLGCFSIERRCYRFNWGEISIGWALGFGYSVYHDCASLFLSPLLFSIYIKVPMVINQRPGTEDWWAQYGIKYFNRAFHFNWRTSCKIVRLPWDLEHVRHTFLWPDGSTHHHCVRGEWKAPEEIKTSHPYTYYRKNGDIQHRTATIFGHEREWRWLWFKWIPWPRRILRLIDIDFDQEVGEKTGSFKGGVMGCGTKWRNGETQLEALRRMEREQKFT